MTILQVNTKTEKKDKNNNTFWELETSSGKRRAWQNKNKDGFEIGSWYDCDEESQEGYATQIIKSAVVSAPVGHENGVGLPAVDWDAKDRATYMESAYASAAQYMGALAAAGQGGEISAANLLRLARAIYHDIQKARAGETFE